MIRLMISAGRQVEPIKPLLRVPQTGERIDTFDGPMVVELVMCVVVPAPGVMGVWHVNLTREAP